MYDPDALERGIAKCRVNIQTFEDAIERERQTMKDYREMIDSIERREREVERAKSLVHIEVDDG